MDLSGLVWVALALGVVGLFLAVTLPLVMLANYAIGARYDERARAIAPLLADEGLRFAEDDVRIRGVWFAALAVGVRWTRADVRVTTRAVYLLQHTRMFGMRMGQPILAFPLRGAILDPRVAGAVSVGWLKTYPYDDGAGAVLKGGVAFQRCTLHLALRDRAGFLAASF